MLITVLALAVVVLVPAAGGRHRGLAELAWQRSWLLLVVLLAQVVLLETTLVPAPAAPAVHVASYLVALLFVLANRHVRGVPLVGAGAASNGLVITLNGGTMPASPVALETAGLVGGTGFVNSAAATQAHLWWLGDVFAVPAGVPLANVFSVGDVLVLAGTVWLVRAASRRPRTTQPGQSPARCSSPGVVPAPRASVTKRAGSPSASTRSPVSTPDRPSA